MKLALFLMVVFSTLFSTSTFAEAPKVKISPLTGELHSAEVGSAMKSKNSDVPAKVEFNNASAKTVKIYWLDFNGKRVRYAELESGYSYVQDTFVSHPWIVADENDNAKLLHMPKPGKDTVTIR